MVILTACVEPDENRPPPLLPPHAAVFTATPSRTKPFRRVRMREASPRDALIGTPTMVLGPLPLNADDHLAGVVSAQQPEEGIRCVLQPVDEGLPDDDLVV